MYRNINNQVEDSFQAFLVEGANFTQLEEYPVIETWMISERPPIKIIPFDKAINFKGSLKNAFICFYSRDCCFERIRKNPRKYISTFKRCAGIIGFDYSVHSDMPIVKQKSQMNDNLSLTYFYAKQGIKIISNIRYGSDDLSNDFLSAIPKNSLIAIGVHGFVKQNWQKAEWYCFLEKIIKILNPIGIVVYGHQSTLFDDFMKKTKFYFYEPWIYENRKERV